MRVQFGIDDRVVRLWKRTVNRRNAWIALGGAALLPVALSAGDLPYPSFTAGTKASASQITADLVNLDDRLDVYEEAIHVDESNGNVGLGMTDPGQPLEIFADSEKGLAIRYGGAAESRNWGLVHDVSVYGDFAIRTSSSKTAGLLDTDRLYIDPNGNVGIGTTTPTTTLDVNGNIAMQDGARFYFISTSHPTYFMQYLSQGLSFTLNGDSRLYLENTGNIGVGTTTPNQRLHIAGKVTADDYLTNSDARLKTDIAPLENAAEGIACLQGVTYRWRERSRYAGAGAPAEDSQALQIGLIAQDVEACFPEVVSIAADGSRSVSYARLVVPLIENAKEQQLQITAQHQALEAQQQALLDQKRRTARLEADLAATNARLARIEAALRMSR